MDFLNIDIDVDASVEGGDVGGDGHSAHHDSGGGGHFMGFLSGALRVVNATEVPIMAVLSILCLMLWMCTMLGNLLLNSGGNSTMGAFIALGSLVAAIILTRLVTAPLKPFFRMLKSDSSENRPVIGRTGVVRTNGLTSKGGQVAIEEGGESIILTARLVESSPPLPRGTEVLVFRYDEDTGIYYVKNLNLKGMG